MHTERNYRGIAATPLSGPPRALLFAAALVAALAASCERGPTSPTEPAAAPAPPPSPSAEAPPPTSPTSAGGANAEGSASSPASPPQPGPPERAVPGDWSLEVGAPVVLVEAGELRLEAQRWRADDQTGLAWRVRVPRSGSVEVRSGDGIVPIETLQPADEGPWALINGGFYDESLSPMGLVVSGGRELHPLRPGGGSGVFAVGADGPAIVHREDYSGGAAEALQSIDRLVDAGASVVRSPNPDRAARAAVALDGDAIWLVVAAGDDSVRRVDEGVWLRQTTRRGLSLGAFAQYLAVELDADTALNLDGGGSVNLAVESPAGSFRVVGERGTCNGLLLRP